MNSGIGGWGLGTRGRVSASLPRGVTLMEVLVAVSLLSLLAVGMLMAMRVGLNALGKSNDRLMANRRVVSVQRILESEIAGLVPVKAPCLISPEGPRPEMLFFQGDPQAMRFVSTYSLAGAWRGMTQILEFQVIPGEDGIGVRLVVNEIPYTSPDAAGVLCMGRQADPETGIPRPLFRPINAGPRSFVLADKLSICRFLYLSAAPPGTPPPGGDTWRNRWTDDDWPLAIRVEMAPLEENPSRLRPLTVTAPVRIVRNMRTLYADDPY